MRRSLRFAFFCAPAAFGCGQGSAETQKNFLVSADIVTGCSVATVGAGSWGDIDLGSVTGLTSGTVNADLLSGAATGVQIDCTPGTTLSVTADTGNQPTGGIRQLAITGNATARIPYQLYANGSATPWTTQAVALSFPEGTVRKQLPIHATATLSGNQRAGAYADTVRVTIAW
jgi:spore coat protein U-like protein